MDQPDYFELLRLPRQFDIDLEILEANYLARSREAHPDFHQGDSKADREANLRESSVVNEAYRTLKDPFRRAEYLLNILGGPTAAEVKDMPQAFLMEMMELRSSLEEIKATRDAEGLEVFERNAAEARNSILATVSQLFAKGSSAETLKAIRRKLNALKFIQGLLRDARDD